MHSHNNGFKTALLMGSMVGMMLLIGGLLSVSFRSSIFIWIMGLFGLASVAYTYWNSDKLALRSMDAYPVSREEVPVLYDIVEELSSRAGQPMPALYVAPTMTPNAFATGRNPQNAAVCCTEGILQLLDEREMRGVLGHELMHVFVVAMLAPIATQVIQMAISRTREFDADEDGARLTGDPLALASALHKLESGVSMYPMDPNNRNTEAASAMMIANPFGSLKNMLSTHPPMDQRIARLQQQAREMGQY